MKYQIETILGKPMHEGMYFETKESAELYIRRLMKEAARYNPTSTDELLTAWAIEEIK